MRPIKLHPVWLPDGSAVALLPAHHELETAGPSYRAVADDWTGPWRRSWRDAANDATYRFTTSVTFPATCERCAGVGRELEVYPAGGFNFGRCGYCDGCARSRRGIDSSTPVLLWSARVGFVWPCTKSELVRGLVMSRRARRLADPGETIADNDPLSYSAKGAIGQSRRSLS